MKKQTDQDRRKHARYSLNANINYQVRSLPSPKKMIKLLDTMRRVKGKDVSAGGLSFTCGQILLPGTVIELKVPPTKAARTGKIRARVVWVSEIGPDKYQVGVKFA